MRETRGLDFLFVLSVARWRSRSCRRPSTADPPSSRALRPRKWSDTLVHRFSQHPKSVQSTIVGSMHLRQAQGRRSRSWSWNGLDGETRLEDGASARARAKRITGLPLDEALGDRDSDGRRAGRGHRQGIVLAISKQATSSRASAAGPMCQPIAKLIGTRIAVFCVFHKVVKALRPAKLLGRHEGPHYTPHHACRTDGRKHDDGAKARSSAVPIHGAEASGRRRGGWTRARTS